jgi:hypothetical protein
MARSAGFDGVRMGLFDRSPLSDSLYAVLGGGGSAQSVRKAA